MTHNEPDTSPDVAAIFEQLRAEVRARRQAMQADEAHDPERRALERQLQHSLEELEITRVVSAHWPLESRSLPQRGVNFVNKVVRRLLRWYINPIVEQQNAFNDTAARTLRLLVDAYLELLSQEDRSPDQHTADTAADTSTAPDEDLPPDLPIQQLQARVEERGRSEPPASFPDIDLRALPAHLANQQQVHAHWPLPASTPLQRVVAMYHKATRFYLRWLINPIVEQQNSFNTALTGAITPLLRIDAHVRAEVAARRVRRMASRPHNRHP
jgi:hypothetical protein